MAEKEQNNKNARKPVPKTRKKGLFSSLLGTKKSTHSKEVRSDADTIEGQETISVAGEIPEKNQPEIVQEAPPRHAGLPPVDVLFRAPEVFPFGENTSESDVPLARKTRKRLGSEARQSLVEKNESTKSQKENEEAPAIQRGRGSTRLDAKKQYRRDPRDNNRRRHSVTEVEFLVRRQSANRTMVVRSLDGQIRVGVLEDDVLVEHYVARHTESSLIGNIYVGKVQNVLPSMEAAFVDIGRGRNAVLYSGEIDWNSVQTGDQPRRIELALKPDTPILVQVTKDPVAHKGARLTSQISLPGRYLVYVPGNSTHGISRKLPDTERTRLKKILKNILPENAGVIVRTAAEGVSEEKLQRDVAQLAAQWQKISTKLKTAKAPSLLHSEPDLLIKIIRDVFNEDFQKLIISGSDAHQVIASYLEQISPDLLDRVEVYSEPQDVFDRYRINEQVEKAFERKVWLPSGGSLVIDRTEAMTVIDVNTGKFIGSGGNLEETVTKNNLEAAEEIIRQLRLRDIGGIIVIDFIDMILESNRDLVSRRLIECLSRDRTKHQVAEVTSLGLVQMTRKKLGLGLWETFGHTCQECSGRGLSFVDKPLKSKSSNSSSSSKSSSSKSSNSSRTSNSANSPDSVTSSKSMRRTKQQDSAQNSRSESIKPQTESVKKAIAQVASAGNTAGDSVQQLPKTRTRVRIDGSAESLSKLALLEEALPKAPVQDANSSVDGSAAKSSTRKNRSPKQRTTETDSLSDTPTASQEAAQDTKESAGSTKRSPRSSDAVESAVKSKTVSDEGSVDSPPSKTRSNKKPRSKKLSKQAALEKAMPIQANAASPKHREAEPQQPKQRKQAGDALFSESQKSDRSHGREVQNTSRPGQLVSADTDRPGNRVHIAPVVGEPEATSPKSRSRRVQTIQIAGNDTEIIAKKI